MIYLNKGFFRPMLILVSAILLPILSALAILTVADFRVELLIWLTLMVAVYLLIAFGIYRYSRIKKHYLSVEDGFLSINHPRNVGAHCRKIHVDSIVKIEYYKILSFRAWCMLYNYVCPQCAYITYLYDGKEICEHIGYPDLKELLRLCGKFNISLTIK